MKGLLRWLGAFVLLVGISMNVRSAGVTDLLDLCTGANQSNCPFKVDSSGNVTTPKVTVSGTSANTLPNLTATTQLTVGGFQSYNPPTTQFQVGASTAIVPLSSYMVLSTTGSVGGSGVSVALTVIPSISTATSGLGGTTPFTDGTILILISTGSMNSITFQDNATLAGSMLHLASTSRILTANKVLALIYRAATTTWNELYYANNTN